MAPRDLSRPYRAPQALPRPPFPRGAVAVLGLAALGCGALWAFTEAKLGTMARLRGDAPGIAPRAMVLGAVRRRFSPHQAEYWLDEAGPPRRQWVIQLTASQASSLREGDTLVVRCLDDEGACYRRDSIYVDDGNMAFDRVLRRIERAGLAVSLLALVRRLRAWRAARAVMTPRP